MARYIDADKIPYYLDTSEEAPMEGRNIAFRCEIDKIPTADVVPKSEVEALEREIERLKKTMLPSYYSACTEEEAIKIGKQYGRAEVASEIISIIETRLNDTEEKRKSSHSLFWKGVYEGREDAYKDLKEIIEQKYTGAERDE